MKNLFLFQITSVVNLTEQDAINQATFIFKEASIIRKSIESIFTYLHNTSKTLSTTFTSSQKDVEEIINKKFNYSIELATSHGYPDCVLNSQPASVLSSKYLNHLKNIVYKFKTMSFLLNVKAMITNNFILQFFNLNNELNSLKMCNNYLNRIIVVNCYNNVIKTLMFNFKTVTSFFQSVNNDFTAVQKQYSNFNVNINTTVLEATSAGESASIKILECANLTAKPLVKNILTQISELNVTSSTYILKHIHWVRNSVNILKNQIVITNNITNIHLKTLLQSLLVTDEFIKQFSTNNEYSFDAEIKHIQILCINKSSTNLMLVFSKINADLKDFLVSVDEIYRKYKLNFENVSDDTLNSICVPVNIEKQISKRVEIEKCLNEIFLKIFKSCKESKNEITEIIYKFNPLQADTLSAIKTATSEMDKTKKTTLNNITDMFKSHGFKPENVLKEIENYFYNSNIVKNQFDINYYLQDLRLTTEKVKISLNSSSEDALGSIFEANQLITKLNPLFNLKVLNTTFLRISSDLKFNIYSYLDNINTYANSLTNNTLKFNYNRNLQILKNESIKCLPPSIQDWTKIVDCLQPLTSKFNKTINKISRTSQTSLLDIQNFVNISSNNIKIFTSFVYAKAKKEAISIANVEIQKASIGFDYRKEIIMSTVTNVENYTKQMELLIVNINEKRNNITLILNQFKNNLIHQYEPWIAALKKYYKFMPYQKLTLQDQINAIENKMNDSIETFKLGLENYLTPIDEYKNKLRLIENLVHNDIGRFKDTIMESKCVKNMKVPFYTCINPIYTNFTVKLSLTVFKINEINKALDGLLNKTDEYINEYIPKELSKAGLKSKDETDKLMNINNHSVSVLNLMIPFIEDIAKDKDKVASFLNNTDSVLDNFQNMLETVVNFGSRSLDTENIN